MVITSSACGFKKKRHFTIHEAKTKVLISCAVTAVDLRLCFRIGLKPVFSQHDSHDRVGHCKDMDKMWGSKPKQKVNMLCP